MQGKTLLIVSALTLTGPLIATPVTLLNPSGEINNGIDRTTVNDPSIIGWNGEEGTTQLIGDRTDYGNGRWRITLEDSAEIFQMTPHVIAAGDAASLRFDAAMFAGNLPGGGDFSPNLILVAPGTRNGGFDTGATGNSFAETLEWTNLNSAQNQAVQATRDTPANFTLTGRNAVLAGTPNQRVFGIDPDHLASTGEAFRATFSWVDAFNWNLANGRIGVTIFTTADDTLTGDRIVIQQRLSQVMQETGDNYQTESLIFDPLPASADGKKLFVYFEAIDGGNDTFARLDNFIFERGELNGSPPAREIIAEVYVDDNGTRLPVVSRTFEFKTPVIGTWDHYHLAIPSGSLDAHAGDTLGIQFRSNGEGVANFQSFDNVRLEVWAEDPADGSFADDWNSTPNQTWAGPGYWANRLQDWEVRNGRVQCLNGSRERLTLHRPGTSIRGNGADFSLSVTTGLNTGGSSDGSRAGFLLGGAPNVDWRGALLVHDGLGRDFGLFLGMTGGGRLVIEDYSTGVVSAIAAIDTAGFNQNTRINLDATYQNASGTYALTLSAFNVSGSQIGTVSVNLPSDRVLGAFGLLSHHGESGATHWFDDFIGTGEALQPEPDRHLAILGAMHTLSNGTLKLTAQLSPVNIASTPPLILETWDGASWQQVATATIDNIDNYSSYTATFEVPGWNDAIDLDYRILINLGGTNYHWTGTVKKDPVDKEELVIAMTTCQRITDTNLQNNGFDWTPVGMWQPHAQTYRNLAKHDPDVLLAHGDQIYEGQPTGVDTGNLQLDYLYKWNLWVLQVRELTRDIPTVAIPDDHDIYQGNLWGEGGISSNNQNSGGYIRPAVWVKMVERSQTSNLPKADPYNPGQPAPPVAQGIEVYFTGMTYGRLGFAILEDRKFKTGSNNPPTDLAEQFLLGDRQHAFLQEWNKDWAGQDLKLVVSQSPMGNLRTHASSGYGYFLNDKDTHGWPVHRRNEAWESWRKSRMFQLAGDQHLATLAHHGVESPRNAGLSFTAPAIANFFPRAFDPVHNASGTTPVVSPYLGDYFFDGNGTLPDGSTPNRTANDPHHFAILAAGNPNQYYQQSNGINPENLHNRGAGYGITRVNKRSREITFECWPIHADPEYPETGGQFPDWPQTFRQTDNDGRTPAGFLPLIDTLWRTGAVVRVHDEDSGELIHAMRIRGTRYRPPVYDLGKTYRVEIAYDDEALSEIRTGQVAALPAPSQIRLFRAIRPSIIAGGSSTLEWDVSSPATLTINQGLGDVLTHTVDGIGYLEVNPTSDTTYTLTLDGTLTAQATIRTFPGRESWNGLYFLPSELNNPETSGGDQDPDDDGFTNDEEFQFQTNPREADSRPRLQGIVENTGGLLQIDFECAVPLDPRNAHLIVESSTELDNDWTPLPSNGYLETNRENSPGDGTSRVTVRLDEAIAPGEAKRFYRASWSFGP